MRPVRGISYLASYANTTYVDNYDWIPVVSGLYDLVKSGFGKRKEVCDRDSPFAKYLDMEETYWTAYLDETKRLPASTRNLALNDANKSIAVELSIGKGSLILLPDSDHESRGDIIIAAAVQLFAKGEPTPAPAWLDRSILPGELEIRTKLKSIDENISRLETAKGTLEERMEEITSPKKILYEKNTALEDAVKKCFEELGFTLSKKGDKDFVASSDVGEAILEVTGSDSSIDIDKLRQLLNYLIDDIKDTGVEKKAILVANHFANDPPDARGDAFTRKGLEESEVHSICLLPTTKLFDVVCDLRSKKASSAATRKRMRKDILCTVGVFKTG